MSWLKPHSGAIAGFLLVASGMILGGKLIFTLGAVIVLSASLYALYVSDLAALDPEDDENELPDAEVVRQKTAIWDPDAADPGNPRVQMHSGGDQGSDSAQRQEPTTKEADEARSDEIPTPDTVDLTDLEYRWTTDTGVTFDDVGGMAELKDELRRDVVAPLTSHRETAQKLGVSAPNIIFHGPPGTGKTHIAQALATELGLPFAQLSGGDVQSKWINESAQKVQQLFEEAKTVAKQEGGAVIFLDELDSVLKNRDGGGNSHEEDNKVVNEFLNHLEQTEDHNIVFIGATNRPESLDSAGIRSGRIDRKIRIGMPDRGARKEILSTQLNDRPTTLTDDHLDQVAAWSDSHTAADLSRIVDDAARNCLYRGGEKITWVDLRRALTE